MSNKATTYRLTSGKHFRREGGNFKQYKRNDMIELTSAEAEKIKDKIELASGVFVPDNVKVNPKQSRKSAKKVSDVVAESVVPKEADAADLDSWE